MAQIKGLINAKGKSGEIIANNGTYFVDLTNATESSGTYTIPSEDIENGDFTLQVGDTLIDKDSGSMLKVATLTPSITASLVFEASSGGGGSQLYQHNLTITSASGQDIITLKIINDNNTSIDFTALGNYLNDNGFTSVSNLYETGGYIGSKSINPTGLYYKNNTIRVYYYKISSSDYDYYGLVVNSITDTIITL